jgi:hypothetical protein
MPVVVLLLTEAGCKKKEPTYYYIDNSFKEWVLFQKGSYWVYLNENNQILDSTFINMQPRTGFTPPESEGIDRFEQTYYDLSNSFIKSVAIDCDHNYSFASLELNFQTDGVGYTAISSAMLKGTGAGGYNYLTLVEVLDTLILNSNIFLNVIHTRTLDPFNDNIYNDGYFAKNIGLVKLSIKTDSFDSTWSLLRWHVVQ